jgi:hypothetical protein
MATRKHLRVTLHCGIAQLRAEVTLALTDLGMAVGPKAHTALVLDAPVGWALWRCQQLEQPRSVIVSDNPCPEYRLDLLENYPATLLSGASVADIVMALQGRYAVSLCEPDTHFGLPNA